MKNEVVPWTRGIDSTCFVISSCSSRGKVANWSNFVPIRNGMAVWTRRVSQKIIFTFLHVRSTRMLTLLKPRACRYHSFTEFKVDFRERSNINRIATASLHTRGSMLTNSRWPPKSQMENVMVVRRTEIVFSIKLTPLRIISVIATSNEILTHPAFGYNPRQNCPRRISPSNSFSQSENLQPSQPWLPHCFNM